MTIRTRLGAAAMVALLAASCGGDGADEPTEPAASVDTETDRTDAIDETHELDDAVDLLVTDAWSRMSPNRAGVAAGYLTITNTGTHDDALLGASVSSDLAAVVELHETYQVDDAADDDEGGMHGNGDAGDQGDGGDGALGDAPMMAMREIAALPIPAGETVELEPGGYHLMLLELAEDLSAGDAYELTLEFERAGELTVQVEVREQP